jgi:hypothetical protein
MPDDAYALFLDPAILRSKCRLSFQAGTQTDSPALQKSNMAPGAASSGNVRSGYQFLLRGLNVPIPDPKMAGGVLQMYCKTFTQCARTVKYVDE